MKEIVVTFIERSSYVRQPIGYKYVPVGKLTLEVEKIDQYGVDDLQHHTWIRMKDSIAFHVADAFHVAETPEEIADLILHTS